MLGSPPHMRGTAYCAWEKDISNRITPAHAGNSKALLRHSSIVKDHPRTCGEQRFAICIQQREAGSPPHMRGTERLFAIFLCTGRITPAHAGNRLCGLFFCDSDWDHPRTCGEQSDEMVLTVHRWGSPPHMRGTANGVRPDFDAPRITPAHAGNRL